MRTNFRMSGLKIKKIFFLCFVGKTKTKLNSHASGMDNSNKEEYIQASL